MTLEQSILSLLNSQRLAVLATQAGEQPYTSLVTLAASPDLSYVAFPTLRNSQKYRNLAACPKAALLVDNRSNQESHLSAGTALTVIGKAAEAPASEREALRQLFLAKHPRLQTFVDDPDCALVKVQVQRYVFVRGFRDKAELDMTSRG
jgi:nitroimidazol reductase NimA-like FMN-containing flavoprotein (pyridoxamine 5'-phosphate oxidase superfamily)